MMGQRVFFGASRLNRASTRSVIVSLFRVVGSSLGDEIFDSSVPLGDSSKGVCVTSRSGESYCDRSFGFTLSEYQSKKSISSNGMSPKPQSLCCGCCGDRFFFISLGRAVLLHGVKVTVGKSGLVLSEAKDGSRRRTLGDACFSAFIILGLAVLVDGVKVCVGKSDLASSHSTAGSG